MRHADSAFSASSLNKHFWDMQGMLLACLFPFPFLICIISFFNQLSFKFFSNQLNTFGQVKCSIYAPLVFLRLSNIYDSKLYLAQCRPASQRVATGHIMMISGLSLPWNEFTHRKRRAGWIHLWGTPWLHPMQSRVCQQGLC